MKHEELVLEAMQLGFAAMKTDVNVTVLSNDDGMVIDLAFEDGYNVDVHLRSSDKEESNG